MDHIFEKLFLYFKTWIKAFIPGVIFAYLSSKLLHTEFATEIIFYDIIILFVIGKVLIQVGFPIIEIITDILSIDHTLQPENFKHLKYIFGSACGIFAILTICWICNHVSSHFFDKDKDYYYLLLVILGLLASIVSFVTKARKR